MHATNPDKSSAQPFKAPTGLGCCWALSACLRWFSQPLELPVWGLSPRPPGARHPHPFPGVSDFTLRPLVLDFFSLEDRDSWECGSHPVWVFPWQVAVEAGYEVPEAHSRGYYHHEQSQQWQEQVQRGPGFISQANGSGQPGGRRNHRSRGKTTKWEKRRRGGAQGFQVLNPFSVAWQWWSGNEVILWRSPWHDELYSRGAALGGIRTTALNAQRQQQAPISPTGVGSYSCASIGSSRQARWPPENLGKGVCGWVCGNFLNLLSFPIKLKLLQMALHFVKADVKS